LKLALEALDRKWDFTLNTDGGYASVRSREKILKRHYIELRLGTYRPTQEFYDALDAYLALQEAIDEMEASPMQNVALHVSKFEPTIMVKEPTK